MNQLQIKVLLATIDKISAPLKKIRQSAGQMSSQIKATQDHIKQLTKQSAQVDSYRKLSRSIGINSHELVKAQRETARLAQEMAASSAPTKELTRNYEQARAATVRLQTQQKQMTMNQQRQRDALRASGIDTRNLASHQRTLTRDLTAANQQLQQQKNRLHQVATQQKRLSAARQSYSNVKQVQGQLAGSGATMLATGAATGYAASRFLQPGLEFGKSQSRVQALTRLDQNDPRLKALREQARQLGATTSFTSGDVSSGQAFLAMAGFTPEAIKAAMPSMLDLAKAGDLELGQSADIASNIMSAFKLPAEQMNRVADVMALTMTTSNVNLQMLGETMKYVAPIANTVGMSLEETAAAAGLLGNIGIQSSQAGTVLRSMLNRLAGPSTAASKIMGELGLNVKNADGSMRNIIDIMSETAKLTEEFGNADRLAMFKELFGEEAAAGINELIAQSGAGAFEQYARQIKTEHNGVAARIAKTMADNAAGDLEEMKSAWEDIGIELFEGNNAAIRAFIKDITAVISSVGQWMKANPELTATLFKVAAAVTGLSIAGGTLALTLAGILGPLAMLKYSVTVLGIKTLPGLGGAIKLLTAGIGRLGIAIMATPVGWLLAAIAAIALAAVGIYKYWQPIKAFFAGFWQGLKDGIAPIADILAPPFIALASALSPLKPLWDGIVSTLGSVWGWITSLLTPLDTTKEQLDNATSAGQRFGEWLANIINLIPQAIGGFVDFGANIISGVINGITGRLGELRDTMANVGRSVARWFKDVLGIKSPSRVFASIGDDTMAGLVVGIQRSGDLPVKEAESVSKRLAATAFTVGLSALPATANTDIPYFDDTQRTITEYVIPAALSPVPDAQRTITEQLQPALLQDVQNTQRTIAEYAIPTALTEANDVQRTITEYVIPAALSPVPDAQRTITEQLQPAQEQRAAITRSSQQNADTRSTSGTAPSGRQAPIHIDASITAPIQVYVQPGMDAQDIARAISIELDKRERQQHARLRATLNDLE